MRLVFSLWIHGRVCRGGRGDDQSTAREGRNHDTHVLFILAGICVATTPAWSVSWHVTTTGNDVTGDGSAANPFATIQHAIDVSSNTDQVLAAPERTPRTSTSTASACG